MSIDRYILILLAAVVVMTGCGVKKQAVVPAEPEGVQEPSWHTCLIQGAQGTVVRNGERLTATVTMQTVRDSMLVISVMPFLGIELMRIEATPQEIIAIDKFNNQYAQTTYDELNRKLSPAVSWEILQQLCSAELPSGPEKARLLYLFGNESIELTVDYTPRATDVPVRVQHVRTDRYKKIDISKWL